MEATENFLILSVLIAILIYVNNICNTFYIYVVV